MYVTGRCAELQQQLAQLSQLTEERCCHGDSVAQMTSAVHQQMLACINTMYAHCVPAVA